MSNHEYPNNPKYIIIQELGHGSFGYAYKVLNKEDNKFYVIKRIMVKNAKEEDIKEIENEAIILSCIHNENVVKYVDSFNDNESFNIVMEFCEGLDLKKFINEHKKKNTLINKHLIYHIISNICLGLKEIHKSKLIHRDLKPANLFLTGDYKVKIGDFGIAKKLKSENEYANTQAGTLIYMAPEIINERKYNNKVDIWALGCIIYELCTLNYCFEFNSIKQFIEEINESSEKKIDENIYGSEMQTLIDSLLNKEYKKRPSADQILMEIQKYLIKTIDIVEIIENSEVYENYLIEKNIEKCMDQIKLNIITKQRKSNVNKEKYSYYLLNIPILMAVGFFTGGLGIIAESVLNITISLIVSKFVHKHMKNEEKDQFIVNNILIIDNIQNKLLDFVKEQLDNKLLKEKIITYNKIKFEDKIQKIKDKLICSKYMKKLQSMISNNFNILLVGNTNVGKSTLINEFLKLDNNKKAKESDGGPTDTKDFTPYIGINNTKQYTLFDTNGITNKGNDSIEKKIENTIKCIENRIKDHDPNKLIHCIWYCLQGTNIQPSDCDFIEKLLNVYKSYSIPIIFVHTQTFSKKLSKTCKKGLEKYLLKIYKEDITKVNEYLDNYIDVLARGDEDEEKEAFGLNELEELSRKEIEIKGFKSSYYEFIKNDIIPILINGIFNLIFSEYNLQKLTENVTQDISKYFDIIINILNDEKLGLTPEIKEKNKIALTKLYNSFTNAKNHISDDMKKKLTLSNLIEDNQEFVNEVYEKKSQDYKNKINYDDFTKKVEELIYSHLVDNQEKTINSTLNHAFNLYIIQIMKEGIKAQFHEKEEVILNEIYSELFKNIKNK